MQGLGRLLVPLLLLLAAGLLIQACGRQAAADQGDPSALNFRPRDVQAVVIAWASFLENAPPPQRTTSRTEFEPLLTALAQVKDEASPFDLLGPPTLITLALRNGEQQHLELWGGYLVHVEGAVTYWVPEELHRSLTAALAPLSPPPIPAPARLSGELTVSDLVKGLEAHGLADAKETGEELGSLLFGARAGNVIELFGHRVQVYTMASPEEAKAAASQDPMAMPISWIAEPHFRAVGNLVVTVILADEDLAHKVLAYLEMIGAR